MEDTVFTHIAKLGKYGLLSTVALLSSSGLATAQTFNYAGTLSNPNQLFQIWFTLPSAANVTIKTTSWKAGNFDPVAWLYDANLNQIAKNDDSCNGQGCSPVSRDSLIQVNSLAAGTYTAIVSAYDQHFWRAGAAGNPPGVIVTGWSYQGDFGGLPPNFAVSLTTSININPPFTQIIFPPSNVGPASPTLISPAKSAAGVSLLPTLTWSAVSGTSGYAVYLGTTNPPTTSTQTTGLSFTPGQLAPATTYYWKVASRDPNNNNTENPSLIWSFTTANAPPPPPPAPALISPGNGATGLSRTPSLAWNPVSASNGYNVYLGTTNPPAIAATTANSSFTPASGLNPGTTYYWKVSSRDPNNNNAESPSTVWSFTTGLPLPPPALVSPGNGATGQSPASVLSWNPVSGSAGYIVYFGTTNPPTNGTFTVSSTFAPAALSQGVTYYWRVSSRDPNNNNIESPSAIWSFTTAAPLPAPTLLSPGNGTGGSSLTPVFTWNLIAGSAGYAFYLGTTNPPAGAIVTNNSSFTPSTALTAGTTYYWMAGSRDPNNNNKEADSPIWSFVTALAAPTLVSPATGATSVSVSPTLSWNAVSGTAGYTVYFGTTNPPTNGVQTASLTFTPTTALTEATTYYWMVASRDPNNGNKEAVSVVSSFTTAAPLGAPLLLSPATGAGGIPVTPTLNWGAVSGTSGYTLYLSTSNPPATGIAVSGTSYSPAAPLTAGTIYYWMVASRDPNNNNKEANSTIWSFSTGLPPPTLISPATGATGVSSTPTLSWNAVTGTAGYSVYLGTTNPPVIGASSATTSFTPATALTPATIYYWMVASRDPNNGNKEANSPVSSFTTVGPLTVPVLTSPANAATGISATPTLSWSAVAGSAGYMVYLGTANPPTVSTQVSGSSFSPAALAEGTTYYWKVSSRDPNNNNAEASSAVWSFTTASPPAAPALVAPSNSASGVAVSPTLTWSAVTGTNGYTVYLGTTNPPTTGVSATGTSYTPAAALTAGATYYWMVASRDPNNNNTEAKSTVWSFTTVALAAPTLAGPANSATGVSVTPALTWGAVTGTNGYTVYLGTTNPPTTGVSATGTSYTPAAALTAGTTYYWMVASRDPNNNNTEAKSTVWSFTTVALAAPTLAGPANSATGVSVTPALTWGAVTGTNGYTVYLGTTNPPTVGASATGTSYTPATALTAGTIYYWMVASRDPNNNNKESNSPVWSFTTVSLAAPTLAGPANSATGVSVTPTLTWGAVTGTNGYTVYLGPTNPPTVGASATGTSYTPATALTAGTLYYWMVASRDPNNNNKETRSAVWSFTTASPLTAPTLVSPANSATSVALTPALTWSTVAGTNGYTVYLGTTNPPTVSASVAGTSYTPPTALTAGTVYYWMAASRDPNNNNTETKSVVWSFTTATAPPNGYSYGRTITIGHSNVPTADQTNFPFLFNTTDPLLKTIANSGHVNNGSGYDIIFTSDAAGTQKLDHEIEYYSASSGQFVAWVRIPLLSHVTDSVIYLFYGNAAITTSQENKTGVWDSNYKAVYHMANNAANTTVTDSTTHHPGTSIANTSTKATPGQIDGALTFNGSTDYATVANGADIQAPNTKTVSFWMKPTDLSGATTYRVLCEYSDSNNDWSVVAETAGNTDFNTIRADIKVAGAETHLKIADNSITAGVFYHVTVVFNNSVPSAIYLNGVSLPLLTPKQSILGYGTTARLTIGARNDGARTFPGVLDEVRISGTVRSADWIKAEYNNQSNPAAFYALGAETATAGGAQPHIAFSTSDGSTNSALAPPDVVSAGVPVNAGPPALGGVRNAASLSSGPISAGEVVVLDGSGFSTTGSFSAQADTMGHLPGKLGETQVFFDGIEAPLLSVHANQLTAVVPAIVSGRKDTHVAVARGGSISNGIALDVSDTAPGVFTQDSSGQGTALALNEDGTVNSADNPAAHGSVMTVYLTGSGATNQQGIDGAITGDSRAAPVYPISVFLGGQRVSMTYLGLGNGIVRVNFEVPDSIKPGALTLVIKDGEVDSQAGVTVNVR